LSCDLRGVQRVVTPIALPLGDGETQCSKIRSMNPPSLLVRPSSRWARSLPTARLDEHRLTENTINPVCAFGEQRKHLARPFTFAEPRSDIARGSTPRRSSKSLSTSNMLLPSSLVASQKMVVDSSRTARSFSPTLRRQSFSPTDPPIALQSFTQDASFPRRTAVEIILPSLLVSSSRREG
jgi:hypothetical protein